MSSQHDVFAQQTCIELSAALGRSANADEVRCIAEHVLEVGIALVGTEVKVVRNGGVSLVGSYVHVDDRGLWLLQANFPPYDFGNRFNHDTLRPRRLLAHKREILKLQARVMQEGVALIPLSLYFKDSRVKLELGLCKGKKLHDKRDSAAERESKRDMERAMKERNTA